MRFSNSLLKSYQRCHMQYDFKYTQGLVPRRSPLPLKRGSWLHELLEAKYSTGSWEAKNDELAGEFNKLFEEERADYGDLPTVCAHIMRSYDYRWREEDERLSVVAIEQEFEVEVPHGHTMVFKVDGIVEDEWGMWLMEHKSHKSFPRGGYRLIDMQTPKYVWGLRKLGYPITGTLWNYISTVEPKRPELLKDGSRLSKKKIRTDAITFLETIRSYGLDPKDYRDVMIRLRDHSDFFRRERVSTPDIVTKQLVKEAILVADEIERGYIPIRSIDRSCEMFCPYMEPCLTSLHGGDISSMLKSRYQHATKDDYYMYAEREPADG